MKKKAISLVSSLVLLFFIASGQTSKKFLQTIILDAGHGGIDPGAKGSFSTEADVSLAVTLKLGEAIKKEFPEIKLIYTRTTDMLPGNKSNKDIANRYRAEMANESRGDLYIAIHCNSAPPIRHSELTGYKSVTTYVKKGKKRKKVTKKVPQYHYWTTPNPASGTETYIWALSKNDAKINSISKNNEYYGEIDSTSTITLPDPSDPAEKARMLVYTQNYFRKSLTFADLIEKGFQNQGRVYRGGVKQRNDKGIWVLQATGMPSVLVEIGFMSSKEEEEYINSEKGQEEIVTNILTALKDYKQKLESRQISSEEKKAF
ncbi:MAG TPA: N-acetylmuramoyl-L-alanine amidase [Chitinophagaceae bacterium]|jgi:N-acetylmuramoyl-L-alanine amidase|nr:N-acetylmuramoyl-L-alanine amidase [Chitinophagaceae bacterium]